MKILLLTFNLADFDYVPVIEEHIAFTGSFEERKQEMLEVLSKYVTENESQSLVRLSENNMPLTMSDEVQYLEFEVTIPNEEPYVITIGYIVKYVDMR